MTRGLKKTVSSIALATAAGLMATSAMAADLGGNCCADLEERVAELEATTARKGNRVVSLTVYGLVNKELLWHDSGEADAYRSDKVTVRDNDNLQTRFGFRGEAKIRPDLSAGYVLEIEVEEDRGTGSSFNSLNIRHSYVYLQSERLGRLALGQTSQITDGINQINLATPYVTPLAMDEPSGFMGAAFARTFDTPFDGGRVQGVYYQTPSLAGFVLGAGWSHGSQGSVTSVEHDWWDDPELVTTGYSDTTEYWEVALRYAGEFNGVRLAAGIGYRQADDKVKGIEDKIWSGSASAMHVPTGLFLSGGYGDVDSDSDANKRDGWWLMAGVQRNFFGVGNTTFYGEYGESNFDHEAAGVTTAGWHSVNDPDSDRLSGSYWGIGAVQSVDAAAMDFYINFRRYELDGVAAQVYHNPPGPNNAHWDDVSAQSRDASVVQAGAVIKF